MPRLYHSPSSISLGARCQHAWALRYIDGVRDVDVPWSEIESGRVVTSRQRSTSLGKGVHAVLEDYYTPHATPAWHTFPGLVARSGVHLLPYPNDCEEVRVEEEIGAEELPPIIRPCPSCGEEGEADRAATVLTCPFCGHSWSVEEGVSRGLRVHGVLWAGFRDLLVRPTRADCERLGLGAASKWWLHDYKSTADIARWSLTPDKLRDDVQCNLYGLDACELLDLSEIDARWIYFETKKVRRAAEVRTVVHADRALEILEPQAKLARELDEIDTSAHAPKNPRACGDYGGCPHHISAGGPCDARRSIGALVQARVVKKGNPIMGMNPALKAKFDAAKNKTEDPAASATAPAAETPAADASAPEAPKRGFRKGGATKSASAGNDDLVALAQRRAELRAEIASVEEQMRAALA